MRKFIIASAGADFFYTGRGNIWSPSRESARRYDSRDDADRVLERLKGAVWIERPADDAQVWDVAE